MLCPLAVGAELLPGYRALEFMGKGGFGEVWKCEAPGGVLKAVKVIQGNHELTDSDPDPAEQEFKALSRLKGIRHLSLLSVDRVEVSDGQLIVVMELAERNLRDVLEAYQEAGQPGVPREELLGYLGETAEALDSLNLQHGLLHLDIKPDNIFVMAGHAKLGDFGLVTRIQDDDARPSGLSPVYAAPEVLLDRISPRSDQYGLAVVYCELRTGRRPFNGKSTHHQMLLQHTEQPEMGEMPAEEHAVVSRALSCTPEDRFPTCLAFIEALRAVTFQLEEATSATAAGKRRLEEWFARSHGITPSRAVVAEEGVLVKNLLSPLLPGLLQRQIETFLKFWRGRVIDRSSDLLACAAELPPSFRSRYPGCLPLLNIDIRFSPGDDISTAVDVRVSATSTKGAAGHQMVREVGAIALESLGRHLRAQPNRRQYARVSWSGAVYVRPVWPSGRRADESIVCQGENVSLGGIAFRSPVKLESPQFEIDLKLDGADGPVVFLAEATTVRPCDGGVKVSARFC